MSTSTFTQIRKLIPFIVSLICAVLFWIYGADYLTLLKESNGPYEFIKMLAGIAGTLLGFLIGAVSLLTAVMDRTLIQNMRSNGQYGVLVSITFRACLSLLILLVACFLTFLINVLYLKFLFTCIIFLSVYSGLLVVSIGSKFKNIFVVMS
ncbi:hypothetical protein BEN71_16710 [Acinetobacter wuhouensis]|uniref:hypothetical protein n=1 Tax=Acinetobacter TaxID=469 RepID=UPI00083ABF77|nr:MULTISPECIES: hypothetical protein [Acinetobacter]AXQ23607.1 hypothetical protein BEN71_16710 [Acinetobacter wuhouensis]RZG79059.1 hypothetical protein EXE10_16485 [Acinetobacter sp. WCHAc060033]